MTKEKSDLLNSAIPEDLSVLRHQLDQQESRTLADRATLSARALRRQREPRLARDYRQAFAVDTDRILNSLAYTRYIDKTQVFYLVENDHITHRVLHVQLVSKVSRTIGRFLGLNEDLIEAIALGHDIGHVPFGHDGERHLSRLCQAVGIGTFQHNLQSVQFLDKVERKGRGWNLCLQTLDGILCHDGEVHDHTLKPAPEKDFNTLGEQMSAKKADPGLVLIPMTYEGCVVRMADTISYVGRDIEDAIRLGLITREELPENCTRVLGSTNGTMVYRLVTDIIRTSADQAGLAFSPRVSAALKELKAFNLQRIYLNPRIKQGLKDMGALFEYLFHRYLDDIRGENLDSPIFKHFLSDMIPSYGETHQPEEIVRDFIAGMTDRYFLHQIPSKMRPRAIQAP
ncbi:MAG: HD domain-containing protein [Desulfobacterales bacterium]